MNAKSETAPAVPPMPRHRRPEIGASVHYFDETRAQNPQLGIGPYAAIVTALGPAGVTLKVFAPYGVLDAERIPHKSELDPKNASRKRWWNWPNETGK
ncbi:MAG TPA: hypothetical protein VE993_01575 [Stellaceae bacterium]|nr:hypothetical protein [Stellaceae bacterium]